MKRKGGIVTETTTEARGGVWVKGMTTVLFVSIGLIIVGFVAVYLLVM